LSVTTAPARPLTRLCRERARGRGRDGCRQPLVESFDDRRRMEALVCAPERGPAKLPEAVAIICQAPQRNRERGRVTRRHEDGGVTELLTLRRRVGGHDRGPGGGALEDLVRHDAQRLR